MQEKLVIGFTPLLDCAPIVAAAEQGFAAAEGITLSLVRETSWANIRDRLVVGHFDAAHMLGPMTIASSLGIGHLTVPMVVPMSLGLGGNAITVSNLVWQQMVLEGAVCGAAPAEQGAALKCVVRRRGRSSLAPLTFGMVYPFSSHNYELRYWLAACGIDPDRDVKLVVIPPSFMVDALKEGQIDGFCVGEPWNSLAVEAGAGTIVTSGSQIWRLCPEKVLGCRAEWAETHPDELNALVRAVQRGAEWSADESNHVELARLLAEPRYTGVPASVLLQGLSQRLRLTARGHCAPIENFYVLATHAATFPWISHALWFYRQMVRWGQVSATAQHLAAARLTYRTDLYRAALAGTDVNMPVHDMKIEGTHGAASTLAGSRAPIPYGPDGFFDHQRFDPAEVLRQGACAIEPILRNAR